MRSLFGAFVVLRGLVHPLYVGHSARFFELKPGMAWPDGSWAFSYKSASAIYKPWANPLNL